MGHHNSWPEEPAVAWSERRAHRPPAARRYQRGGDFSPTVGCSHKHQDGSSSSGQFEPSSSAVRCGAELNDESRTIRKHYHRRYDHYRIGSDSGLQQQLEPFASAAAAENNQTRCRARDRRPATERRLAEATRCIGLLLTLVTLVSVWPQAHSFRTDLSIIPREASAANSISSSDSYKTTPTNHTNNSLAPTGRDLQQAQASSSNELAAIFADRVRQQTSGGLLPAPLPAQELPFSLAKSVADGQLAPLEATAVETMMTAASKKKKMMKKKKKMEKKHKEWKKGKKHNKKKYESKKKKGGSEKKKKGKKEKKKWGMEKKGHKKKGNFKKKKWGSKKKMKKGHKKGKKGHKMLKDKGHKKKGFKKIYHKEEWGKKKKWHDIKREKKWNTKQKKWKKKWHQEKGKKYKGKHMKKYHKKNKHGKKYKKEKKSKWKKHKGEKFKKGHKKKKEEYSKKKEGGKKKKMKKMKKEMKKKKKG